MTPLFQLACGAATLAFLADALFFCAASLCDWYPEGRTMLFWASALWIGVFGGLMLTVHA